jgi:hypothetical protein
MDGGTNDGMALISRYYARTIPPEFEVMLGLIPVGTIVKTGMA